MKCPYRDSFMPRCQITVHPDRPNVEYCRVCGEWRYLSDVGDDFAHTFWTMVAIAIVMMVFVGLINESETPRQRDQRQRERRYLGRVETELVTAAIADVNTLLPPPTHSNQRFSNIAGTIYIQSA
ncbi:hypothetical protein OsccyDRAFT_2820 [Leptolyngbyaceae cyanobacterium JSC-12]|nr:hypothetical protein OsccyDRAFT_2820 [Leptolyngbyaceae cyanobacterium JSC-12]